MSQLEPCIETYNGHKLYFLDPQEEQIDIADIAHALANECRFGGHTRKYYSVAEHSILVATLLPKHLQLAGLLHDASEAYLRDIASPIKSHLTNYRVLEDKLMNVIARKFNIVAELLDARVKEADVMALKCEAKYLLPSKGVSWLHYYPTAKEALSEPRCFTPEQAEGLFLAVFNQLSAGEANRIWLPPERKIAAAS